MAGEFRLTLGCRAFFFEFLSEFDKEKKRTDWEKLFCGSPGKWTGKMLGTRKSRRNGDYGVIGRIGKKFGYEIEAEWRRIDQIWYHYLPRPETWKETPWKIDVLIEHENYIENLDYTLFKFEEISVPMKVGIFYPESEDEEQSLRKSCEIISKQISSYPGAVHLIIFGFLEEGKRVYWHGYEIDVKGNVIKLHEP